METLAYLHVAENYEDLTAKKLVFWQNNSLIWQHIKAFKFSSQATFWLVGLTCTSLLGLAQTAEAVIQFGDRSPEVTQLQTLLRQAGFFAQEPTGYYGSVTEDAVRRFQESARLTVDGIVGDRTMAVLNSRPRTSTPSATTNPPNSTPSNPVTSNPVTTSPTSTTAATGAAINRTLGLGDVGTDVTRLQELLRAANFFTGNSTGFFGSVTEDAVARFQQSRGLGVDGVVGPLTLAALQGGRPGRPVGGNITPRPDPVTTSQTLRSGDRGTAVSQLQQRLADLGYFTGPITGTYGPLTEAAVQGFQSRLGLEVDGIFGPTTAQALS